jgi:hypothetical protein
MLIQGAFVPLTPLEWVYAVGYTGALLGALSLWSCRAFHSHVVMNVT